MQPFSIIFIKNTHFPKSWHTPPVFTEIFPEHLAYILIGFWKVIFFICLSEVLKQHLFLSDSREILVKAKKQQCEARNDFLLLWL